MEARFPHLFYSLVFSCIFICTGCVNEIASETSEIQEGNIPITFSVEIEKSTTKVTDDVFDANDKIGLYALITGNTMADERYIDNLLLTCGKDQNLISERDVFYPEGDNTLDFIAYYPYNSEGVKEEQTIIPVSIHPNQEEATDFSASDFMTASKQRVSGSSKPVSLEFEHRLSKLKIILIPSNSKEADEMLKDDPHIIATGFYTQANYDLEKDEFTGFKNAADITPTGKWEVESGKLIGKEFIILPQEINDEQVFQIDWNGRIYTCPVPSVETLDGNKLYEIEINTEESESSQLSGLLASISDWPAADELEDVDSENGAPILHLSALSFEASNVYRVHLKGREVAEICKEYLADDLDSRAITIYPVQNGVADLENGTILQLLDTDEEINGGELQWDLSDNTFSYYEDDLPAIQAIYFDQDGNLHTDDDAIQPAEINVVAYTLTDRRNSADIQQYPIVKIGTQYWLRENLRADRYSDGKLMEEQDIATGNAGYHTNDEGDYFYNGEALKAGTISPKGWGIPSTSDWESLDEYIEGDVSMLKTGEWGIHAIKNTDNLEVSPVNNKTMFSIKPLGNWSINTEKPNINVGTMAAFWTWDYNRNDIPEQTVFFIGESNDIIKEKTINKVNDESYYKGLSLRLIKK